MRRLYDELIQRLSQKKLLFLSGPRQVGKTTLAEHWIKPLNGRYLSWDIPEHKAEILQDIFTKAVEKATTNAFVLDEIHKYHRWKLALKGVVDRKLPKLRMVVTGSAMLDVFKKRSDSLLGRYEQLRVHPFTLGELTHQQLQAPPSSWLTLKSPNPSVEILNRLLQRTGFPEPYLSEDPLFYQRWSHLRRSLIVHQDLREAEFIKSLSGVEELAILLPEKVGNLLSVNSIREQLGVAFDTAAHWIEVLERLYYCFRIAPYAEKVGRALRKEKKLYLWDYAQVRDEGAKFENLIASHLLKSIHLWNDLGYGEYELKYFRDKQKREVDFIVIKNRKPIAAIEAKLSDETISPSLFRLKEFLPELECLQILRTPRVDQMGTAGIRVVSAELILGGLN